MDFQPGSEPRSPSGLPGSGKGKNPGLAPVPEYCVQAQRRIRTHTLNPRIYFATSFL